VSGLLLTARLLLAVVFALAGASKLTRRDDLRETLAEFRLPSRAASGGAFALPPVELVLAGLLVPATTARWAAAGALVLLIAFCAAIGRSLARGERPDCGCFGRVRSTPIGPGTLVRNGGLAAAAAFVVAAGPGKSIGDAFAGIHLSPLAIALTVVGAVVAVQGWFSWQLFEQHGRLLARIRALEEAPESAPEGLPLGAEGPPLELFDERLAPELPLALVFSNTGCGACETLAPELERLREEREGELEIVLVADNREALEAYRIVTVPSATVVDPDGRIAIQTVVGATSVQELLSSHGRFSERLRLATA
jgi:uncharacterized membrane protein YphA (DoxX/SURF4 family)